MISPFQVKRFGMTLLPEGLCWVESGSNRASPASVIHTDVLIGGRDLLESFLSGKKLAREEMIDAESLQGELTVRNWQEGDRFAPLGGPGEKTLGDFFTDQKVPVPCRRRVALICDDEGIVWVAGQRIAKRVRVTGRTRVILKMTLE